MIQANRTAFVDKLCERLTVESGTSRVYEALLPKLQDEALRQRLAALAQRDFKNHQLLSRFLDELGVEDRATPSVRLAELESRSFVGLIEEADTDVQLLHVLLTRELADECGWELLINLARDVGEEDLVRTFSSVLKEKKEHLRAIRGAVANLARQEVTAVL